MKILVIDNYDSFVYNLIHIIKELNFKDITIIKNDKISIDEVAQYDKILLSPGPGIPKNAGIMPEVIQRYAATKSILGVCLGHQAIAEAFGAKLINLPEPLHGIDSQMIIEKPDYLFEKIPSKIQIGHYHSWVVSLEDSDEIEILAKDERNNVMAIKHKLFDLRGVQFHPESVLTEYGKEMIKNWISN